jgi:hypothetical protein
MIKELNHNRPITPLVTGDTGSNKTQYFFGGDVSSNMAIDFC